MKTNLARFESRTQAGHRLATALLHYRGKSDAVVIGLPRGGVVTAAAIAGELQLPMDVLVVRKLGLPGQPELAVGAIGPGGVRVVNEDVVEAYALDEASIRQVELQERAELERRECLYRGDHRPLNVAGKTVIVVDDGLATGSTMTAAVAVIRAMKPARIVVAVPVAPRETCEQFEHIAEEVVCVATPSPFLAVGLWYEDFDQVKDEEVIEIVERARSHAVATV